MPSLRRWGRLLQARLSLPRGDHRRACPALGSRCTCRRSSRPEDGKGHYLAILNHGDTALNVDLGWNEVGLALGQAYHLRDLWDRRDLGSAPSLKLALPPHACALYRVSR